MVKEINRPIRTAREGFGRNKDHPSMKGIRKAPNRKGWGFAMGILWEILADLLQQGHGGVETGRVIRPRVFHEVMGSADQPAPAFIVVAAGVGVLHSSHGLHPHAPAFAVLKDL